MKRRILLPLVLLAGLSLAGCKWFQKEESSSKYKVEITNKAELQADWYAGTGSSRGLSLTLTPEGNPVAEMANGNLVVTSSNPSVANITGLNINALAEGDTKVTVKYHGAKDSVDLTILPEQTIPVKYGVTHYGTAEDPLTNEEALIVAKHANYAGEDLYVGGTIASFYHAPGARDDKKVSWFLEPAQPGGEKFEIYLCLKADNTPLTDDDVWVGGYAVAHGPFTKYNSQYETSYAVFDRCEGNKPQPRTTIQSTFATALEVGAGLADGADSYDYHQFDAYVTAKEGSNYFLTATQGEELVSATSDEAHGSRSYYSNAIEIYQQTFPDALTAKLKKDAKITVTMILKNYHGQIENMLALSADDVVVVTEGGEWSYEQLTVAQALAKIEAIDISGVTQDKTTLYAEGGKNYQVTGIVVAKGNTWTDASQYKNADFYIADTAGHANRLQVFRYADKTIFDSLVVDATQVKVTCQLAAYVRVTDGTPSIGAKETNQNPTVEVLGTVVPTLSDITISPLNATADILEGEQTVQFTAHPVPETAQLPEGIVWTVTPTDAGVTIDENGLATIAADAVEDDETQVYNIYATLIVDEQELSNVATLTVTKDTAGGGGQEDPEVKISELKLNDVVTDLKARVMAVGSDNKNFFIDDGYAGILAYASAATTGISAGDCVTVSGTVSTYNKALQIGSATITKSQDAAPTPTTATALTAEDAAAMKSANPTPIGGRYSLRTGVVSASGNYLVWSFGSIQMENGAKCTAGMQAGKVYDIEGYIGGIYSTYLLFVPTAATEVAVDVEGIALDKTEANVRQGATLQLNASATPAGAQFSSTVQWSTSDATGKVSVSSTGLVSVAEDATVGATATITAMYNAFTATCEITVEEAATPGALDDIDFTVLSSATLGSSELTDKAALLTAINSASITSISEMSKVYAGNASQGPQTTGLKLGTGSAAGSITFVLASAVTEINLSVYAWSSSKLAVVTINGAQTTLAAADATTPRVINATFGTATDTITISFSMYAVATALTF